MPEPAAPRFEGDNQPRPPSRRRACRTDTGATRALGSGKTPRSGSIDTTMNPDSRKAKITVVTPEDPPVLNQEAAQALLRMLIECADRQNENHRKRGGPGGAE